MVKRGRQTKMTKNPPAIKKTLREGIVKITGCREIFSRFKKVPLMKLLWKNTNS